MFFTLPANIDHFSRTLETNNLYLFDPVPSYVPGNHAASPPYFNPHGGGHLSVARANKARVLLHGAGMGMGGYQFPPDRVNQKEVTRQQVDAIYSSVQTGGELDHSDPGPNIKTELFPHQKKALTFLLEREQDLSSLKKARKANDKSVKKALAKLSKNKDKGKNKEAPTFNGSAHVNAPDAAPEDKENGEGGADGDKEQDGSTKDDPAVDDVKRKYKIRNRSLWKPTLDAKGKVKSYRHKITQDEIQVKKGDPPPDCKGAILADDVSHIWSSLELADEIDGSR
jgi:SWI/SNF-related matrix-associated actin-dependent regulator of chromatin subfamily A3